jgi:branched-chain amino acid transport system ATP-binding protein
MVESVLDIRQLSCAFGGLQALTDFDLNIISGETVGIIGPNGAGKSVLVNLITRFYDATAGVIIYDGRDISKASIVSVARAGIARTFQNIRLFRRMTVLENVLAANPTSARHPFRASLFADSDNAISETLGFLELMGLTRHLDKAAGSLPYGLARRLEIARALATHPKLLFLDEPAAGMNEEETAALINDIRSAAALVDAIVLIEHDMALIKALSSRVVAMNAGRKICEGAADDVLAHPEVKAAYLGSEVS